MNDTPKTALIARINHKGWWHVPPRDPQAYDKRGKFYASSFREGEFWGRPLDAPERVSIRNPIVGDEPSVQTTLFGKPVKYPGDEAPGVLRWRWRLDARMKNTAQAKGYDAIVIMAASAFKKYKTEGKIPRSIELNVLSHGVSKSSTLC